MPIVDAPFSYAITLVRKGRRAHEDLILWDKTPVTVAELDPSEAPIAISAAMSREPQVDYRYAEGALWRPLRRENGGDAGQPIDEIADREHKTNPFVPALSPLKDDKIRVSKSSEVEVREVVKTGRGSGTSAAQAVADDLRLIGGVLHEKSSGPVFWIVPGDKQDKTAIVTLGDAGDQDRDYSPALVFRADDLAAVETAMKHIFKTPAEITVAEPTFVIPGVYAFDEYSQALVETARALFGRASDDITVGSLPNTFLRAWYGYKDPDIDPNVPSEDMAEWVRMAGEKMAGPKLGHLGRLSNYISARFAAEPAPAPALR